MREFHFYCIMAALVSIIVGIGSIALQLYSWLPRLNEAIYMVYVRLLP